MTARTAFANGTAHFSRGRTLRDGLAWGLTQEGRRLASMPDLVAARMAQDWTTANFWVKDAYDLHDPNLTLERYFTTASALFRGIGASGKRRLVVAHGTHPLDAASDEPLTPERFLALEAGKYGAVQTFDLDAVLARLPYGTGSFTLSRALGEPFLLALLGPQAEAYLRHHHVQVQAWYVRPGGPLGLFSAPPPAEPEIIRLGLSDFLRRGTEDPAGAFLFLEAIGKTSQEGSRYQTLACELNVVGLDEDTHRLILFPWSAPLTGVAAETGM